MVEITKYKPTQHKIKALIYWSSGAGKTVFSSTAPKPLFISAEGGLLSIQREVDRIEIRKFADLQQAFKIVSEGVDYETIIIDSISEINEIIKNEIEKTKGRQMEIQDRGILSKRIRWILQGFRDLDYHILLIAQEEEQKDNDKIHKVIPSLNWKSATTIAYFMDIVAYISVQADWTRLIQTLSDPKLLTKDRTGKIWNKTTTFQEWVNIVEKCGEKPANIKENKKVEKDEEKKPEEQPVDKVIEADKLSGGEDMVEEETTRRLDVAKKMWFEEKDWHFYIWENPVYDSDEFYSDENEKFDEVVESIKTQILDWSLDFELPTQEEQEEEKKEIDEILWNKEEEKEIGWKLTKETRVKIMWTRWQLKRLNNWNDKESEKKRKWTMLAKWIDSFSEGWTCTEAQATEFLQGIRKAIDKMKAK